MIRVLALLAMMVPAAVVAGSDPQPWPVGKAALEAEPVSMQQTAGGPLLTLADGTAWNVVWKGGAPALQAVKPPAPEMEPGMLPDGRIVHGTGQIRRAWLSDPTDEYGHAILGDGTEAKSLTVETADGKRLTTLAPANTVFEDLYPRLWDLDGDGEPEAWVIRSGAEEGGLLEAYTVHEGRLIQRFATDPIGLGYRWLNPVGVADFTGDGQREVALIRTPHIGGVLILYRPAGLYLDRFVAVPGLSNHAIGSRELQLHWVGDIDGDGTADVLLPGQSRREMAAFSMAGEKFRLLGITERTGHIETGFAELRTDDGGRVILFADDTPALRWLRLPD